MTYELQMALGCGVDFEELCQIAEVDREELED